MRQQPQAISIIADDQALADSLQRVVRACRPRDFISTMTYRRLDAELGARIRDRDTFVLGLFRQYAGGLRAEGVALAELLLSRGKKVLVVSPLHVKQLADNPMYWDTASTTQLSNKIGQIIGGPLRRDSLMSLKCVFAGMMAIPPQH